MRWDDKRYHTLNYEMKKEFGHKVIKLSLDGGFTCPNRDGRIGRRGCIFCGEKGAGDFAGSRDVSIPLQLAQQKELVSAKWPKAKYIAYFQNFTNTYAEPSVLKDRYETALAGQDVVGLAIATRPDCLPEEVLELLGELAKRTYIWVELGLQTIHPRSAAFIRRGYDLECFLAAAQELKARNIKTVTHLILGLPNESRREMLESVQFVAGLGIWGVKLHMLHIQQDADLYTYYLNHPFPILTKEEYVSSIADALECLPPDTVIHRLTGDGSRKLLVAPDWSLDKRRVLLGVDKELARRDSYQGSRMADSI